MNADYNTVDLHLEQLNLWNVLLKKCKENNCEDIIALIRKVGNYSVNKLKTVIKNLSEFTLHDEVHVFNMLLIVDKLIPLNTLENLSIPDLMMIILSIFLHDIGMCPEEKYIKAWKGIIAPENIEELTYENIQYRNFRKTYPNVLDNIEKYIESKEYSRATLLEEYLICEYIRKNHAPNARKIIATDWNGKIIYKNTDLLPELIDICFSHNESYIYILNMETIKICDYNEYLCVPFVAVILRLADIIDFDPKRTPDVLFAHLSVKNPVSINEWKKHQSINAWTFNSDMLVYSAQCEHPATEAAIRKFCDMIDYELSNCTLILSNINSSLLNEEINKYKIHLPTKVNREKISAKKDYITGKYLYKYHETIFTLNKTQVIDLLMGTKLYENSEVVLRELIQNSIDACMVRKILCESYGETYIPRLEVSFYIENGVEYLCVDDNGIGMNQYVIDNYYTKIGSSYYRSSEFYELMGSVNSDYQPISRFGIGILSSFMVCDEMEVNTRKVLGKYNYDEAINLFVEGYESLFVIKEGKRKEPGTCTVLKLRKNHPWKGIGSELFFDCLQKSITNPPFPIAVKFNNSCRVYDCCEFGKISWDNFMNDNHWLKNDSIKFVDLNIDNIEYGFKGKARIAYIVKDGIPVLQMKLPEHIVQIDKINFELSTQLYYNMFGIFKESLSIELIDKDQVSMVSNSDVLISSNSIVSINGIGVPCNIFRNRMNYAQKSVLDFPLPILLLLDVGQNTSLNLNTARTQIIYDNDWKIFEKRIIESICKSLSIQMTEKWKYLKNVICKKLNNKELEKIVLDIE